MRSERGSGGQDAPARAARAVLAASDVVLAASGVGSVSAKASSTLSAVARGWATAITDSPQLTPARPEPAGAGNLFSLPGAAGDTAAPLTPHLVYTTGATQQ